MPATRHPIRALAAGLLASLIATGTAAAQDLKPWRHGIIEPKGDGGFSVVVSEKGFGQKQGLKVEIVALKSGALAQRALLAGEIDSVASGPGVAMLAASRGADVKIVGCDWKGAPQSLLVRPNIKEIGDLRGKTVAVAAPGSLAHLMMKAILEKNKIPESEVRFANLGSDLDRFKAVAAGVADAGVVAIEFLAGNPKDVRMLISGRDIMPDFVRSCFMMTGAVLKQRRDDAIGFVAAEMEALQYAVTHRDETIKLTRELIHAKPDDPRPAFAYDDAVNNKTIDPDVSLPLEKLIAMQDDLVRSGGLRTPLPISAFVDPGIRAEALKRLKK